MVMIYVTKVYTKELNYTKRGRSNSFQEKS